MNYKQTLDFMYSRLPMYQRVGAVAYKKDLTNTLALCAYLGNPQTKFKSIHIAGTNGKGSVAHMLASAFMENGYLTGLYTSPHLLDFRERIKCNGQLCEKDFVVEFVKKIKPVIDEIKPSFFEITVAMAFDYFAKQNVDVAIIETGLGGRLDSTNVIDPLVSVITNISLEHTQMLGASLAEIATEKAGIMKANTPVVIGEKKAETKKVFEKIARDNKATLYYAEDFGTINLIASTRKGKNYEFVKNDGSHSNLHCDLLGSYQSKNILTSLNVIDLCAPYLKLDVEKVKASFAKIISNTGLHGRWELVKDQPQIILDISHNPKAIENMLQQLKFHTFNRLHIVLGMSADKDANSVLKLFPQNATYYFARPDVPRGMDTKTLYGLAAKHSLRGNIWPAVGVAVEKAMEGAAPDDLILITGSAFVVADALAFLETSS